MANGHVIAAVLQDTHLLPKITIVHCSSHVKEADLVFLGNDRTDKVTKYAAPNGLPYPCSTQFLNPPLSITDTVNSQANSPHLEKINRYKGCQTIIRWIVHL